MLEGKSIGKNVIKWMFVLLVMACGMLIATSTSHGVTAVEPHGEGSANNPYKIESAGNMIWLSNFSNECNSEVTSCQLNDCLHHNFYAVMTDDIDMSSVDNWTPICKYKTTGSETRKYTFGFCGTFDGKGHKITGFHSSEKCGDYFGLFGCVGGTKVRFDRDEDKFPKNAEGTVKNLTVCLKNKHSYDGHSYAVGDHSWGQYIGVIAGFGCNGVFENCSVKDGEVFADSGYVGGICGWAEGSYFLSCSNECTIFDNSSYTSCVGGICGYARHSYNNFEYPTLSGYDIRSKKLGTEFRKCTNSGKVWATGDCVGGICGFAMTGDITGREHYGSYPTDYETDMDSITKFKWCKNSGEVYCTNDDYIGGILGDGNTGSIYYSENTGYIHGGSSDYIGGMAGRISRAGALEENVNHGKVAGEDWIGGICGSLEYEEFMLNADGHYVFIEEPYHISHCTNSETGNVSGDDYVGGCFGYADVDMNKWVHAISLHDMDNRGTVNGNKYVAGIIGDMEAAWLSNCLNLGNVKCSSDNYWGGIIGFASSDVREVQYCFSANQTKIPDDNSYSAGICGRGKQAKTVGCYTTAKKLNAYGSAANPTESEANISLDRCKSGEIAYKLSRYTADTWGQKIGTDDYPQINVNPLTPVYYAYKYCDVTKNDKTYTNAATSDESRPPHDYDTAGKCNNCDNRMNVEDFEIDIYSQDGDEEPMLLAEKVKYNTSELKLSKLPTHEFEDLEGLYYKKGLADEKQYFDRKGELLVNLTDFESAGDDNSTLRKLVLAPKWRNEAQFTINIDYNGGVKAEDAPDSITIMRGDEFPDLPVPTREGYVFTGYKINSEAYNSTMGGDASNKNIVINSDGSNSFETSDANLKRIVEKRLCSHKGSWNLIIQAQWKKIDTGFDNMGAEYLRTIRYGDGYHKGNSEYADNLFDNDAETKWCYIGEHKNYDNSLAAIVFKTGDSTFADHYTFTIANDTGEYEDRNPRKWKLYGGHTDTACTYLLDEREAWYPEDELSDEDKVGKESPLPNDPGATVTFEIPEENRGWYEYYKLVIVDTRGKEDEASYYHRLVWKVQLADFDLESTESDESKCARGHHNWELKETKVEPTCETDGVGVYECTREGCNATKELTLDKKGHDLSGDWVIEVEPSCVSGGQKCKICKRCGKRLDERYIPEQHKFGDWIEFTDCYGDKGSYHVCDICGYHELEEEYEWDSDHAWDAYTGDGYFYLETVITKKPTCTTPGSKYEKCQGGWYYDDCDFFKNSEVILPYGHNMSHHDAEDPTCDKSGNIEYWYCDKCKKYFLDENGDTEADFDKDIKLAPKHTHLNYFPGKEATCTLKGNKEFYHCMDCDKYFWDKDCTDELTKIDEVVIPLIPHDLVHHDRVEATGTTDGNIEYWSCENCGWAFADANAEHKISEGGWIIPKTDHAHNPVKVEAKESTCTAEGNSEYWKCSICDKCFADEACTDIRAESTFKLAKKSHKLTKHDASDVTCEEDGRTAYWQCSDCHNYFSDAEGKIPAEEDSWVIPATGHEIEHVDAVEATHAADGNIEHYACKKCNQCFSDSEGENKITKESTVVKLDHEADIEKVEAKAATCEEDGNVEYYKCDACGAVFADENCRYPITNKDKLVIEKLGHKWDETHYVIDTPATCTEDGEKSYHCTRKNCDGRKNIIPLLAGHSFDEVYPREATCSEPGIDKSCFPDTPYCFHCTVCGKYYSDVFAENEINPEIPVKPHEISHVDAAAATCTTDGNTEHWACKNCGKRFLDENGLLETTAKETTIEATGHDLVKFNKGIATCVAPAIEFDYWYCGQCEKYFKDSKAKKEIPKPEGKTKPHQLSYVAAKAATCTDDGHVKYWTCETCHGYFKDSEGKASYLKSETVIPAKGHDWHQVIVKAGLLKNGAKYMKCSRCGLIKNKVTLKGWATSYVKSYKLVKGKKSITAKWAKRSAKVRKKFNGYQIRFSKYKTLKNAKYIKLKKTTTSKVFKNLKSKKKYYIQIRTYTKKNGKTFYSEWTKRYTITK